MAISNLAEWYNNPAFTSSSGGGIATSQSGPAYARVSGAPSWFPTIADNTAELRGQYADTGRAFSTSEFDRGSKQQQSRLLTSSLNAGQNAAAEYANRARQAGGSAEGAGLVKAEAQTSARMQAGEQEMKRLKFDADQRAAAAAHSVTIANSLATMRQDYLKTLSDYATKEDAITTDRQNAQIRRDELAEKSREFNWSQPVSGSYITNPMGQIGAIHGTPFRDPNTGLPTMAPGTAGNFTPPPGNFSGMGW